MDGALAAQAVQEERFTKTIRSRGSRMHRVVRELEPDDVVYVEADERHGLLDDDAR